MQLYNTPMLNNIGVSFNYIHLHILSEMARTLEANMRHEVYFFIDKHETLGKIGFSRRPMLTSQRPVADFDELHFQPFSSLSTVSSLRYL